ADCCRAGEDCERAHERSAAFVRVVDSDEPRWILPHAPRAEEDSSLRGGLEVADRCQERGQTDDPSRGARSVERDDEPRHDNERRGVEVALPEPQPNAARLQVAAARHCGASTSAALVVPAVIGPAISLRATM